MTLPRFTLCLHQPLDVVHFLYTTKMTQFYRIAMASERDFAQGKIYTFRPISECFDLGIDATIIPHIVRRHMVLVVGAVPGMGGRYVKVMTVSTEKTNQSSTKQQASELVSPLYTHRFFVEPYLETH
jgi:hypothetical protein